MNNFFKRAEQAYFALMRQKLRTILTIFALSIGIASVVMIMSAGAGLKTMVLSEMDIYSPNTLNIEVRVPAKGETGSAMGMATGITITTLKNSDMEEIGKHKNIDAVYNYVTSQQIIKYQQETKKAIIFGYGAAAPKVEKIEFAEGRFYTEEEESSLSQVVVLGSAVKERLFGDDQAVGKIIFMRGKSFRVVGVLVKRGASFGFDFDNIVYVPAKTVQKRMLGTDYSIGINARVIDMSKINQTKEDIEYLLRERHDIITEGNDDFKVTTMDEIRQTMETIVGGITLLLIALVCISLIVGGVGITNIMYVSVTERTFEIGLRKAVGAKKNDVLWQFLLEAIFLTFSGGVLGVIVGFVLSYFVYCVATNYGLNWSFSVSISSIILALSFSTIVGLFFGVYPARKAAHLQAVDALRRE